MNLPKAQVVDLSGVETQRYNILMHTDGPLSRGRYKTIKMVVSSYLLEVRGYIHHVAC